MRALGIEVLMEGGAAFGVAQTLEDTIAGKVGVKELTPDSATTAGAAEQFTHLHTGNPPVTSGFSLTKGPAAGDAVITITGHYFTGASAVSFGTGAGPASFEVHNDSSITIIAPPGPSATVGVQGHQRIRHELLRTKRPHQVRKADRHERRPAHGLLAGGTAVTVEGSRSVSGEAARASSSRKASRPSSNAPLPPTAR